MRPTDGLLCDWFGWVVSNQQENEQPEPGAVLFDDPRPAAAYAALYMFSCTQCDELFLIKGYCFLCKTPEKKFFIRLFDGFHKLGDVNERQLKIIQQTEQTEPDDVDFDKFFLDIFDVSDNEKLTTFLKEKLIEYNKGKKDEELRKRRDELKSELAEIDKQLGDAQ